MTTATITGYPRIGPNRELKRAPRRLLERQAYGS